MSIRGRPLIARNSPSNEHPRGWDSVRAAATPAVLYFCSRMRPTLARAAAAAAAVQCCSAFSLSHPAAVPAATGGDRASSFTSSTSAAQGTSRLYIAGITSCAPAASVPSQAVCVCLRHGWGAEKIHVSRFCHGRVRTLTWKLTTAASTDYKCFDHPCRREIAWLSPVASASGSDPGPYLYCYHVEHPRSSVYELRRRCVPVCHHGPPTEKTYSSSLPIRKSGLSSKTMQYYCRLRSCSDYCYCENNNNSVPLHF